MKKIIPLALIVGCLSSCMVSVGNGFYLSIPWILVYLLLSMAIPVAIFLFIRKGKGRGWEEKEPESKRRPSSLKTAGREIAESAKGILSLVLGIALLLIGFLLFVAGIAERTGWCINLGSVLLGIGIGLAAIGGYTRAKARHVAWTREAIEKDRTSGIADFQCPRCSHRFSRESGFCPNCSLPVKIKCGKCGEYTYRTSRFCGSCGAALETPP